MSHHLNFIDSDSEDDFVPAEINVFNTNLFNINDSKNKEDSLLKKIEKILEEYDITSIESPLKSLKNIAPYKLNKDSINMLLYLYEKNLINKNIIPSDPSSLVNSKLKKLYILMSENTHYLYRKNFRKFFIKKEINFLPDRVFTIMSINNANKICWNEFLNFMVVLITYNNHN